MQNLTDLPNIGVNNQGDLREMGSENVMRYASNSSLGTNKIELPIFNFLS